MPSSQFFDEKSKILFSLTVLYIKDSPRGDYDKDIVENFFYICDKHSIFVGLP